MTRKHLGWLGIVRLGLVQSALGGMVALTTSTLNRIMVVELALPAMLPAALVGLHYAVQMSRPAWGHGSDIGNRRTPWIIGGMGMLALGLIMATDAAMVIPHSAFGGIVVSIIAYCLIGMGVGASGTSLLALLATSVAPERRPAAASITWIMMIMGIVLSAGVTGALIEPFTPQKLAMATSGVAAIAFLVTLLAVHGVEDTVPAPEKPKQDAAPAVPFRTVMKEIWAEPLARRFTIFVFISMLAYSAQDLILEPFAGLVFKMTPGQSTQLSGMQNGGVLLGMILVGVCGARFGGARKAWLKPWTIFGCLGSALGLVALSAAAIVGPSWPLAPTVFALGFANGIFAVSAIGSMMGLASAGKASREGARMGVWGASQAVAFGLGGFLGAAGVDAMRAIIPNTGQAFLVVFALEAMTFLVAAWIASRLESASPLENLASHETNFGKSGRSAVAVGAGR